ncbi:MAG: ABC transporter substrate-binding protein, partial [Chloroflexi bacterium]|nr:ABC transporter substrate-binding protein [Chloroflexota bacterium]
DYQKDQQITLTANSEYWGGAPKLSKLNWRFIPETSTRVAAFKAGEVAIADGIPPEELDAIGAMADASVPTATTYQEISVGLNCSKAPWDKPMARQALNYAIDKDTIIKDLLVGHAAISVAPAASTVFGAVKQDPYPYDPAKAKALLQQAGVSGAPLVIDIDPSISKGSEVTQYIASQLSEVGVAAKASQVEAATWSERRVNGTFDASLLTCSSVTGDADLCLALLYFSKLNATTPNRARYNNPAADDAITKGATSLKDADRLAAYSTASQVVWQDAPHIWLYDTQAAWAVRKTVQGFVPRPDTYTIVRGVSLA